MTSARWVYLRNNLTSSVLAFLLMERSIVFNRVVRDPSSRGTCWSMVSSLIYGIKSGVMRKVSSSRGYIPSSESRSPSWLGVVRSTACRAGCCISLSSFSLLESVDWESTLVVGCSSTSCCHETTGCPASVLSVPFSSYSLPKASVVSCFRSPSSVEPPGYVAILVGETRWSEMSSYLLSGRRSNESPVA